MTPIHPTTHPSTHPTTPVPVGGAIWRRCAVALTAVALVALVTASPAAAHDQLIESTPEAGSIVEVAPVTVTLRFRDEVMDISSQVIVHGPTGDVVADVEGVVDGTTVSAPLPAELGDGTYRVAWRVVAGDGHPLQGAFEFSVGAASAPLPSSAASPSGAPQPSPSQAPAAAGPGSGSSAAVVVSLGGIAALITAAAVWLRRRDRTA